MERNERLRQKAIDKINKLIVFYAREIDTEKAGIVADEQAIAEAQGAIMRLQKSVIDREKRIETLTAEKAEALVDKHELEN